MSNTAVGVEKLAPTDREWVLPALVEHFGGEPLITPGGTYSLDDLDGFKGVLDGLPAGFAHFSLGRHGCELVTLLSLAPGRGVGNALLEAVCEVARQKICHRVWVSTTNDNLEALGFYQRRGFHLVTLYADAMDRVRRHKPGIPLLGQNRIPLRDMLELEISLEGTLF